MQAEALAIAKDAEADECAVSADTATETSEIDRLAELERSARRAASIMRSTAEVLRLEAAVLDD